MSLIWSFIIAIGLCFDTFAVSVSSGMICNHITFRQAIKFSIILAILQGAMPLAGWLLGSEITHIAADYDHWVAFGLLIFIGIRMMTSEEGKQSSRYNPLIFANALLIGFTTSIDALAVGFSMAFIQTQIIISVFIIGFFTFMTSMIGLLIGKKTMGKYNRKLEIAGGLIMIGLGIKILISHLWFS